MSQAVKLQNDKKKHYKNIIIVVLCNMDPVKHKNDGWTKTKSFNGNPGKYNTKHVLTQMRTDKRMRENTGNISRSTWGVMYGAQVNDITHNKPQLN